MIKWMVAGRRGKKSVVKAEAERARWDKRQREAEERDPPKWIVRGAEFVQKAATDQAPKVYNLADGRVFVTNPDGILVEVDTPLEARMGGTVYRRLTQLLGGDIKRSIADAILDNFQTWVRADLDRRVRYETDDFSLAREYADMIFGRMMWALTGEPDAAPGNPVDEPVQQIIGRRGFRFYD